MEDEVSTSGPKSPGHTNRLIDSSSPYLLSHAHNPVDWYEWGEEALQKAKTEDKPIFLSIGYAACHWCHVMERESFENEDIAALLNEHFVSIKVDREQRPDLDQIYMSFTTAMTGSGGWPMSVFLTPGLKPFFAGTYFPPRDAYGRPGFRTVLEQIAQVYKEDRERLHASADAIFDQVKERLNRSDRTGVPDVETINRAASALLRNVDSAFGGIGQAPKFPHALEQELFFRQYRKTGDLSYLNAATGALTAMARGGIYDHLGGGFARYSVDRQWLVPHFEKMLYDNALLVPVYAQAYRVTGDESYLQVVSQTLDFLLREMTKPGGGHYSAIDADSEGVEGKFYTWDKREIDELLGEDSETFCRYYNVTEGGNFEGQNILHVSAESDRMCQEMDTNKLAELLARCRMKLMTARDGRTRPLTDDKILSSWNGLVLRALAIGYQVTMQPRYLSQAITTAGFLRDTMYIDRHLVHAWRDGRASEGEFLEDYAYLAWGLLELYQSDPSRSNVEWLKWAQELIDRAMALFADDQVNFYLRPEGQSDLIMRPRDETDASVPAPGSIMIDNLLVLSRLTDETRYEEMAQRGLQSLSGALRQFGPGMTSALLALDRMVADRVEVVLVGTGEGRDAMFREIYRVFVPNRLVALSPDGRVSSVKLFEGRAVDNGEAVAYVCRNNTCRTPARSVEELGSQLADL
jgi:uncharacterized protein